MVDFFVSYFVPELRALIFQRSNLVQFFEVVCFRDVLLEEVEDI